MKQYSEHIHNYLKSLNRIFTAGLSTEHSFRGDLRVLLEKLSSEISQLKDEIHVTNEPRRIHCGAPDYIVTQGSIPIGYIEAKDLGSLLTDKRYKEQFERYKSALPNLILTNYLDFVCFEQGQQTITTSLGEIRQGKIIPLPENFAIFTDVIKHFLSFRGQTISSASRLAEMMANKARLIKNVIELAVQIADENDNNSSLQEQMEAFRGILIHDMTPQMFADIYAQTVTYGMFAARIHNPQLETFTRSEAATLIPKSNPFLRRFFQHIAGYDLDDRVAWVVDSLADVYQSTDIASVLTGLEGTSVHSDPVVHFYETFLSQYDPKLRKSRGVYYTPTSAVRFIVRAVDDLLEKEFKFSHGLADVSKVAQKVRPATKKGLVEEEQHKVQILDPAVGTGTFLSEIVRTIFKRFKGKEGIWNQYVEEHLIPRLNGFEILMAPYAMAHLKLDLTLSETGFRRECNKRFRIYLTNSLEEHHPDTGTLFAKWLSNEANEANFIKRDTPVLVVLGNPPYSISSSNKGDWIQEEIQDYKIGLSEKKSIWMTIILSLYDTANI